MQKERGVREIENIEKAEYRSIRKSRSRKEEQKEKLQNRADIEVNQQTFSVLN